MPPEEVVYHHQKLLMPPNRLQHLNVSQTHREMSACHILHPEVMVFQHYAVNHINPPAYIHTIKKVKWIGLQCRQTSYDLSS